MDDLGVPPFKETPIYIQLITPFITNGYLPQAAQASRAMAAAMAPDGALEISIRAMAGDGDGWWFAGWRFFLMDSHFMG